jgi:hypothetical protein
MSITEDSSLEFKTVLCANAGEEAGHWCPTFTSCRQFVLTETCIVLICEAGIPVAVATS